MSKTPIRTHTSATYMVQSALNILHFVFCFCKTCVLLILRCILKGRCTGGEPSAANARRREINQRTGCITAITHAFIVIQKIHKPMRIGVGAFEGRVSGSITQGPHNSLMISGIISGIGTIYRIFNAALSSCKICTRFTVIITIFNSKVLIKPRIRSVIQNQCATFHLGVTIRSIDIKIIVRPIVVQSVRC